MFAVSLITEDFLVRVHMVRVIVATSDSVRKSTYQGAIPSIDEVVANQGQIQVQDVTWIMAYAVATSGRWYWAGE